MMIDAVVTIVYRDTVIQRVASIPRYAAKKAELQRTKLQRNPSLPFMVARTYVLIPFAIKDDGRIVAHDALALLKALAAVALEKGRRPPFIRVLRLAMRPRSLRCWHVWGETLVATHVIIATPRHLQACHEAFVP